MADANDPKHERDAQGSLRAEPARRSSRFEDEVPSPRILKLALIAAAIIVVIALIIYFRARHEPPALHNEWRTAPAHFEARNLSTANSAQRRNDSPEVSPWIAQRMESPQPL